MTFPPLFPRGKASFLEDTHEIPLTFKDWWKYLTHYYNGRFAKDSRFRFFCLNTMQRHDSIASATILARKSDFGYTPIEHLRQEFRSNFNIINNLLAYGAHIRGGNAYWSKRRNELESVCSSLYLWCSCMQRHLILNNQIFSNDSELVRKMRKAWNENLLTADEYFAKVLKFSLKFSKKCTKFKIFGIVLNINTEEALVSII